MKDGFRAALMVAALTGFVVSPAAQAMGSSHKGDKDRGGVVYAMTNDATHNEILTFIRKKNGRLHAVPGRTASTGGAGASTNAGVDPLGSQGSLVYDADHGLLFAVNAGDDTVTSFDTGGVVAVVGIARSRSPRTSPATLRACSRTASIARATVCGRSPRLPRGRLRTRTARWQPSPGACCPVCATAATCCSATR